MIVQSTLDSLRELKLPAMAAELKSQLETPDHYKGMGFEERLGLLTDAEKTRRWNNAIKKRHSEANFCCPTATIEGIEYLEDRNLDKGEISRLATCTYIRDNHHLVLVGASGSGKSYLACALGDAACRKNLKVAYTRLPDLLDEYAVAKSINSQQKVKDRYAKKDLLVIDEWLLRPIAEEEAYDLLEIIDACSKKGAIIFCSQYDTDSWYYRIDYKREKDEESTVAEAILDRFIHNKYKIELRSAISMRKRYGVNEKVPSAPTETVS